MGATMYATPSAPLTVGGIIEDAIRLHRHSFASSWVPALVLAFTVSAANTAVASRMPGLTLADPQRLLEAASALVSPDMIGWYVLGTLAALVCYGALFSTQLAAARGEEPPSAAAAFAASCRRLPGIVLAIVVSLLPILFGLAAMVIPNVYAILLGLAVLLIAGVYVSGRLQLWMVVMFAEHANAFRALARSWQLMQGRWWRGSTILTVAVIIMVVLSSAAAAIAGGAATACHAGATVRQIITQLVALPTYTIIGPLPSAVCISMYRDFKLRHAGGGLVERAEALNIT